MIDIKKLKDIVNQKLSNSKSLFLVDIRISPANEIVVEIDSDKSVGIDDCVHLSNYIEEHFDRDIEDYELEVGSSGLTNPLKIPRQYQKYINKEIEVLKKDGIKISGLLIEAGNEDFVIRISKKIKPEGAKRKLTVEEDLKILYTDIKYAKYIISIK